MYPQLTAAALTRIGPEQTAAVNKAYNGVLAAWKEYLKNDNDGRGVIFLGHSQGSGMVKRLIRTASEQCVHRHRFETPQHASRVIGDCVSFYNTRRPYQALRLKTPAEAYALTT